MTKNNIMLLAAFLTAAAAVLSWQEKNQLKQVQAGEKSLACEFKDGWRIVDPDLVIDFIDDVWVFENGHAKNCKIKEL